MVRNSFGNRNFMQPIGRVSMHSKCLDFYFLLNFGWGGGGEDFFHFSFVPKFLPWLLAQAKNGDLQFWKQKFHAANGNAQHALMNDPVFSFLRGGIVIFFCFLPLFPMCSHKALIKSTLSSQKVLKFSKCSQMGSSRCSQQHLGFIPYGLPKVQLPCL